MELSNLLLKFKRLQQYTTIKLKMYVKLTKANICHTSKFEINLAVLWGSTCVKAYDSRGANMLNFNFWSNRPKVVLVNSSVWHVVGNNLVEQSTYCACHPCWVIFGVCGFSSGTRYTRHMGRARASSRGKRPTIQGGVWRFPKLLYGHTNIVSKLGHKTDWKV